MKKKINLVVTKDETSWHVSACDKDGCTIETISFDRETVSLEIPTGTTPYITSEMEHQIKKMKKLGINTTGQTFEQMVSSLILLAESMYTKEQMEKTAFDYYHSLSKAMHVPDELISKDDPNFLAFVMNLKVKK